MVAWHHGSRPGTSTLKLTVPANATATARLATSSPSHVTESHRPLNRAVGVQLVGMEHGDAILRVGAGTYEFQTR